MPINVSKICFCHFCWGGFYQFLPQFFHLWQKLANLDKECNDIFENCDEKALKKFIAEQQEIQDNIDKLWVTVKRKMTELNPVLKTSISTKTETIVTESI